MPEISQLLKTTGLTAAAASRAIGRGKDCLRDILDGRELWPDSDDPRYQTPIIIPNGGEDGDIEVQIVALVLYQFSQAR